MNVLFVKNGADVYDFGLMPAACSSKSDGCKIRVSAGIFKRQYLTAIFQPACSLQGRASALHFINGRMEKQHVGDLYQKGEYFAGSWLQRNKLAVINTFYAGANTL